MKSVINQSRCLYLTHLPEVMFRGKHILEVIFIDYNLQEVRFTAKNLLKFMSIISKSPELMTKL